jgi:hypothetical protein
MNQNSLDSIAEIISSLENLTVAMGMKVPAQIHLEALKETIPEIREKLLKAYLEAGGENYWE